MSARSSASVSNSLAAREVVVGRRQHLLLDLVERDRDLRGRSVGDFVLDVLRLAGRHAGEGHLELVDHPAGAELDHHVAAGFAGRADDVDDDDVAVHRRPALHRRQLGHRVPQRLDLGVDELGRRLGLGTRHLERPSPAVPPSAARRRWP